MLAWCIFPGIQIWTAYRLGSWKMHATGLYKYFRIFEYKLFHSLTNKNYISIESSRNVFRFGNCLLWFRFSFMFFSALLIQYFFSLLFSNDRKIENAFSLWLKYFFYVYWGVPPICFKKHKHFTRYTKVWYISSINILQEGKKEISMWLSKKHLQRNDYLFTSHS